MRHRHLLHRPAHHLHPVTVQPVQIVSNIDRILIKDNIQQNIRKNRRKNLRNLQQII